VLTLEDFDPFDVVVVVVVVVFAVVFHDSLVVHVINYDSRQ